MTQKELAIKIDGIMNHPSGDVIDDLLELINQHVKEVIGEREELPIGLISGIPLYDIIHAQNMLKLEQRERAGL